MLRNVPHDGSSHHRFPYKMITILLTTFLKLYRRSPSSYKINKPVGNLEKFGISQRRGWDLILSQRCWHSCHFHRAQLFTCGCVTRMYKHTSIIRDLCVHTEVLPENSAAQDVGMKGTGWRGTHIKSHTTWGCASHEGSSILGTWLGSHETLSSLSEPLVPSQAWASLDVSLASSFWGEGSVKVPHTRTAEWCFGVTHTHTPPTTVLQMVQFSCLLGCETIANCFL